MEHPDGTPSHVYDDTNLQALRRELERLNEAAVKTGLIAPDAGADVRARNAIADGRDAGSGRRGKAGASRLLRIMGRIEGDDSPLVPGTRCTEQGVVRLLAHLDRPRSQQFPFLVRMHRFLVRPVPRGTRTSAGISVERLQVVSRQLQQIKALGWEEFRSIAAARRGAQLPSSVSRRSRTRPDPAPPEPTKAVEEPR